MRVSYQVEYSERVRLRQIGVYIGMITHISFKSAQLPQDSNRSQQRLFDSLFPRSTGKSVRPPSAFPAATTVLRDEISHQLDTFKQAKKELRLADELRGKSSRNNSYSLFS